MRFLKDMMVRNAPVDEDEGAASVIPFQDAISEDRIARKSNAKGTKSSDLETAIAHSGDETAENLEPAATYQHDETEEMQDEGPTPAGPPDSDETPPIEDDGAAQSAEPSTTKIWEMFADEPEPEPEESEIAIDHHVEASKNELAREALELLKARATFGNELPPNNEPECRAKTRLLGFNSGATETDIFASQVRPAHVTRNLFPLGWLAITKGPGRGESFPIFAGMSQIGRGEDQAIRLDFGDTSISRSNHAAIAYDHEQNTFFIGHGGKANIVRLNGKPVLSTEPIVATDEIRIGETTLRFVALCDDTFQWVDADPREAGVV